MKKEKKMVDPVWSAKLWIRYPLAANFLPFQLETNTSFAHLKQKLYYILNRHKFTFITIIKHNS